MRYVSLESLREAIPKPETNMDHIVHCCTVEDIQEITHDTNLYTVKLPVGSSFTVPTGHHVAIRANIDGTSHYMKHGTSSTRLHTYM